MKSCYLFLITLMFACPLMAEDRINPLTNAPQGWDNTNFAICYYNGNSVYNLRSVEFCRPGKVISMKVSPNSLSFAVLYAKKSGRSVKLYSYTDGRELYAFKLKSTPTAIAYSANAKYFMIATDDYDVLVYNLSTKEQIRKIRTTSVANNVALSNNGYFVAAIDGDILYIHNAETGRVRKVLEIGANINWVAFSPDNSKVAVLVETGKLYFYDTKTFNLTETYDGMGDARCCSFHPEGKYISVITASDKIKVINMKNPTDREEITSSYPGITQLGYCSLVDKSKPVILAYNNAKQLVFHELGNLVPDYEHLVADEVETMMDDWMKMMPGETLEDYQLRVNDETRAAQYAKFENEIATEMAGDKVGSADVSFGSYNQEQSMLEVNFDNMPSIYLEVPQEDVAEFSNPEKLSFDKSVYGVGKNDQFELLYTEVTNTETGKKYVFDNMAKQSLEYLASDDNFVPLDLIQQSSMEEVTLQEIRQEVVEEAQEKNLISDHTHIGVKTKVAASTDADGNKIMNYNIDFNYVVDSAFSVQEDFHPGKYNSYESASAEAMLKIVKNAFEKEFRQYVQAGKKVQIIVTGAADALPISRKISYGGEYGDHEDETVTKNGELSTVTLTVQSGITSNEQLAFARALSVKDFIIKNITELQSMHTEYDYVINVSNEYGAEFRRIGITFIFLDAFQK